MKGWAIFALCSCFALSGLTACSATEGETNIIEKAEPAAKMWDGIVMSDVIPYPPTENIEISNDTEKQFSARINDAVKDNWLAYVEACKNAGFSIDEETLGNNFVAFNGDGYELYVSFHESDGFVSVVMNAPKEFNEISWPPSDKMALLPAPKSNMGKIEWDSSDGTGIHVANMSRDDYNSYVDECSDGGFNQDYQRSENFYSAFNADEYRLQLEYQGYNTILIKVDAPEEKSE